MEAIEKKQTSRPPPKRPLPLSDDDDDGDSRRPLEQRKVRFPKGKKAAAAAAAAAVSGGAGADEVDSFLNPDVAAKERAKKRHKSSRTDEEELQVDISKAEVRYKDNANFLDDGIQIEPFNLDKEREEGYFDANGNFVEYARDNNIKDAWLDSVDVDTKFAGKIKEKASAEGEYHDLSSQDIGKIKWDIANILEPGETIIQALKRLKGTDKHGKMPESTKDMFDKLTESAMKLMENGEYNVYHEERETFQRESEGYERLARARGGESVSASEDIFSDDAEKEKGTSFIWDGGPGPSAADVSTVQASSSGIDSNYDMFGDDDDDENKNKNTDADDKHFDGNGNTVPPSEAGAVEGVNGSDYVYDPSSGYYYSSSLGYYYDATSGLYCCASTGTWYSFDEKTGTYNEVQSAASAES